MIWFTDVHAFQGVSSTVVRQTVSNQTLCVTAGAMTYTHGALTYTNGALTYTHTHALTTTMRVAAGFLFDSEKSHAVYKR